MDPSIRPIQNEPTRPAARVHRRREGEAFEVPEREPDADADDDEPADEPRAHDDRPVGPRPADEAGSHLDLTA